MESKAPSDITSGRKRQRHNDQDRTHKCDCGKAYLSYPALYTHKKNKHSDKKLSVAAAENGLSQSLKNEASKVLWQSVLSMVKLSDLRILSLLDPEMRGTVPLQMRIKMNKVPRQIYECFNLLVRSPQVALTPKSPLHEVLTIYLLNVGEFVHEFLYEAYLDFARSLLDCHQVYAEDIILISYCNGADGHLESGIFSQNECRFVPIICDFFARCYLPQKAHGFDPHFLRLMLFDFCGWMAASGLTDLEIMLQEPYALPKVPPRDTPPHRIVTESTQPLLLTFPQSDPNNCHVDEHRHDFD